MIGLRWQQRIPHVCPASWGRQGARIEVCCVHADLYDLPLQPRVRPLRWRRQINATCLQACALSFLLSRSSTPRTDPQPHL